MYCVILGILLVKSNLTLKQEHHNYFVQAFIHFIFKRVLYSPQWHSQHIAMKNHSVSPEPVIGVAAAGMWNKNAADYKQSKQDFL